MKTREPKYSKRYLEIIGGYKEDIELTHEQLLKHLHPDDFCIREKAFKEALISGYLNYAARLIWNDQSIHWMEGRGKVFYDEEGNPEKLIGTIRDITAEKEHQQELEESEYKFRLLADSMPQHIWTSDPQGNLNYYNQSVFNYSGLTLEQINKDGWMQIVHPDDREENIKQWISSVTTGKEFLFEHRFRKHDGEYRWQLSRAIPQRDEHGKIQMWVGTSTDIHEQKKAQEQFKVLADQAPMWVWLTDKQVNILYTNPEVLKFFDIAHYTEFTGNMWEQKVHPDEITMVYKTFGEAASLQQSFSFEFRVQNAKTLQYEWFYIKAVPRLEDGEFTGFIGTGININEQKSFAKELEEKVITRTAELKASEEKFYNLFNLSPISKTLSDTSSGKIVMVNDAFTKLFGYSPEDAIGKSSAELGLLDPEAREKSINELKISGKIENQELLFIKKSGENFIALASAEVITLGDRQFFLSAFNDISEIKKAEQNIKQKNIELENKTIQLEEAQQLAHLGSWEWDVLENKIEWSDELFRIFGLTPQQFKADYEHYLKYIHPDDRAYVNSIVQQALQDHQPYSFFHKTAEVDGKIRILSATGKVFTDGVGNVIRMSGTAQDVTEQKNYEEELKMSEERFYKIFDSNPVPMSLSEIGNSKIKYANNRFYNVFGYTQQEVIGRSSEELNLIDPEETKRVVSLLFEYLLEDRPLAEVQALSKEEKEALLLRLKHSEKMKDFEILYTRKNGEKFPALVSFEVIKIGVDSYTVASYQDITERKNAEAQLRIQNEQLEKMNRELESFAYISSHDLQEPLRKIQTFSTRILEKEEDNLSDSGKEMFNRMQDAAKRMQILIQDLLAYSRTTTTEHQFETTDLNKIVAEVKDVLKEELIEKLATIEANQLCDADIIPFQFRQLLHNLISNALKFSNPNHPPIIQIRSEIANGIKFNNEKLSPQNKYCHITVSDNGIGFEEQYNEKIFEVFQRLHSKKEYAGTGIGLSIVKKIVENHNGIVTATGVLNKGATFDIYIPSS
ncbi:MAG: PAS domain S-box protein [Leadbetterella sp.]|nr:PAS domain S-box protein [Leadbetterella sp.]